MRLPGWHGLDPNPCPVTATHGLGINPWHPANLNTVNFREPDQLFAARDPGDRRFEFGELDRLGQVGGEAGIAAPADVVVHAVA